MVEPATAASADDHVTAIAKGAEGHSLRDAVAQAWQILDSVTDPEIPVVSLKELGILRDIRADA